MDLTAIKSFLDESFNTKSSVQEAADVIGVSVATMYRYKSNPETIGLGQISRLATHFGLPLTSGAAWAKTSVVEAERRRLTLESSLARKGTQGRRLITLPAYTVNSELPEVTRWVLKADYGTRAASLEAEIMKIRRERTRLYDQHSYESWEIWNGFGYHEFFHARGRFSSIPATLRTAQIRRFVESSTEPTRHRFVYLRNTPELPMFGCHVPPGIALVRVDDIHLESQDPTLVESFEKTFNDYREKCVTTTTDQFVSFLENPVLPESWSNVGG
jgi:hypothetical protein